MKCCALQRLSKNVSHGVVALQGRPPSHAEEDHPILRLRGVLVNKRLQLKNSSIQVYTICEAKLALFIAIPTVYRSRGSREVRPQERRKTSPRSFKPRNRHAAADVGGGSISSALDSQHAIVACYFQFMLFCCICPYLDFIATSIFHSKLDYCNSFYFNLAKSQLNCLELIQNFLAHATVKAPKFSPTTPILKSLHQLQINERINYKLLSLTYEVQVLTTEPSYLYTLISLQPPRNTRSSSSVTISHHLHLVL